MEVPQFPEHQHPLIKPLAYYSDSDLLALFQRQPGRSRYFVTLFCRYSTLVYALVQHLVRSPKQADYLFASAWRDIFYQLPHLPLPNEAEQDPRSLQHWIINRAVVCLNQMEVPPSPQITYSLVIAHPPSGVMSRQPLINCLEICGCCWSYPKPSTGLRPKFWPTSKRLGIPYPLRNSGSTYG